MLPSSPLLRWGHIQPLLTPFALFCFKNFLSPYSCTFLCSAQATSAVLFFPHRFCATYMPSGCLPPSRTPCRRLLSILRPSKASNAQMATPVVQTVSLKIHESSFLFLKPKIRDLRQEAQGSFSSTSAFSIRSVRLIKIQSVRLADQFTLKQPLFDHYNSEIEVGNSCPRILQNRHINARE